MSPEGQQIEALQDRVRDLESAGKKAGAVMALSAVVSAVAGIVVGAFGVAFYIRDELAVWEQIKAVHENASARSGIMLYDHTEPDPKAVSAMSAALHLPDFGQFATKADLPDAQIMFAAANLPDEETLRAKWDEEEVFVTFEDLEYELEQLDLLKNGDAVRIRYASNESSRYLDSVDFNVVTSDQQGLWALER